GQELGRLPLQQLDEAGRGRLAERPRLDEAESTLDAHTPALGRAMFFSRSAAVGDSVRSCRTCASVPRSGSSMKIFFSGPSLRSKITESQLADTISSA